MENEGCCAPISIPFGQMEMPESNFGPGRLLELAMSFEYFNPREAGAKPRLLQTQNAQGFFINTFGAEGPKCMQVPSRLP